VIAANVTSPDIHGASLRHISAVGRRGRLSDRDGKWRREARGPAVIE
jgi:hypothetical protein